MCDHRIKAKLSKNKTCSHFGCFLDAQSGMKYQSPKHLRATQVTQGYITFRIVFWVSSLLNFVAILYEHLWRLLSVTNCLGSFV